MRSSLRPLRVVLVSPQAHYPSHFWRDTHALARALSDAGVQVKIIVSAPPIGGELAGARVHRVLPAWWGRLANRRASDGSSRLFTNLETLACVLRALPAALSGRGDIIHFLGGTHIFIFLLALLGSRPVFFSIYGEFLLPANATSRLKDRLRDWLLDRVLRARKFVVICETDALRDRWRGRFGEHIHTIPYAITVAAVRESKAEARAALGLPADAIVLLLFGTQREGKDYGVVLRAASLLQPAVHLLFVGQCISRNDPQRLAEELKFTHATFVDRFIDDAEAPRFFCAADAVVLPYEEGFDRGSGVIIDACAYSRPIIASRTGYLQWFVERHQVGFLYEPGDSESLTAVIRQLLLLTEQQRLQLEARVALTAKEHTWSEVVQTYLRVYRTYCR